ncbi:hypothetical protein [Thermodesulfatator atlanticus]
MMKWILALVALMVAIPIVWFNVQSFYQSKRDINYGLNKKESEIKKDFEEKLKELGLQNKTKEREKNLDKNGSLKKNPKSVSENDRVLVKKQYPSSLSFDELDKEMQDFDKEFSKNWNGF